MKLTRRLALLGLSFALGLTPLQAQETETETAPEAAIEIREVSMGAEDAPVTLIEYASLTCPHCMRFHVEAFAPLKKDYVETGKVRYIVRDVYFDRYGLWAMVVARCGTDAQYFSVLDTLYRSQPEWSRLSDPAEAVSAMRKAGLLAGMTNEALDTCLADEDRMLAMIETMQKNMEADGVTGTPTLFVNGEKHPNLSYDALKAVLDEAAGS